MKLVKMVRSVPEVIGGPVSCDIQIQDKPALESRGWVQDGEEYDLPEASGVSDPEPEHEGQGTADLPEASGVSDPEPEHEGQGTADLPEASGVSDKEELVQKAIELKLGSPSTLSRMSVAKLEALIKGSEA